MIFRIKQFFLKKTKVLMILPLGITLSFLACNSHSNNEDNLTVVNEIPSFSNTSNVVGCQNELKESEECRDVKSLNAEDHILNVLMKKEKLEKSPVKSMDTTSVKSNEVDSVGSALTAFVEDVKLRKNGSTKKNLEVLVESVSNSDFANDDNKAIGTFDIEKFSSTWQELQALVDNSEETKSKRVSLQEDLQLLVVSASTEDSDTKKVGKRVKALLEISSSSKKSESIFAANVMADMTSNKIELLDANDQWIKIRIKEGDTLSRYAEKYYGDANKYMIIYDANREKISDDFTIYVDSILKIPTLNSI